MLVHECPGCASARAKDARWFRHNEAVKLARVPTWRTRCHPTTAEPSPRASMPPCTAPPRLRAPAGALLRTNSCSRATTCHSCTLLCALASLDIAHLAPPIIDSPHISRSGGVSMDVVRARVGWAFEWAVAALFLIATLAVASLVLRELRAAACGLRPGGGAGLGRPGRPAGACARTRCRCPCCFSRKKEIKVGHSAEKVAGMLGREAETVPSRATGVRSANASPASTISGTRFTLVFEAPGEGRGPKSHSNLHPVAVSRAIPNRRGS